MFKKHWKKILLSTAALFWAGCGGDSENSSSIVIPPQDSNSNDLDGLKTDTLYGIRPVYNADSGSIVSSDNCQSSSSSNNAESSSSAEPLGPYKLASDTSVTCKVLDQKCDYTCFDKNYNPFDLMDKLENNETKTLEQLEKIENDLEYNTLSYGAVYGCMSGIMVGPCYPYRYKCSNDSIYYKEREGFIYTDEEFNKKYPPIEPKKPSPFCKKTDFVTSSWYTFGYYEGDEDNPFKDEIENRYEADKKLLIDSVKNETSDSLTNDQIVCLDSNIHLFGENKKSGPIATTQICDGDTTVNPRYQAKLDSNRAYIMEQVEDCLKQEEQESDTTSITPTDSSEVSPIQEEDE